MSVSDGHLLRKETNTEVQSRYWGRSSSPADERLGAIVLHCLFWQFFKSPKLIEKLFQKGIYGTETLWAIRKQMSKMIDDKQMKWGDCEFLF